MNFMLKNILTKYKFSSISKQYDIVVVGGNLGSILTNQLSHLLNTNHKMLICYDNPYIQLYPQRSLYQCGRLVKTDVNMSVKSALNSNFDHTNGLGVKRFKPNRNELILKNDSVIKYRNLVIAMGMKKNIRNIKGFDQCWSNEQHPFYTCRDHHSWKSSMKKSIAYTNHFENGQTIFYIPPKPYFGQLENFNFLLTYDIWKNKKLKGQISSDSTFTILNADNKFSYYCEDIDKFFKKSINQREINLETGSRLIQVNKNNNIAVFQNLSTGYLSKRKYSSFYSLIPSRPHYRLIQAGLTTTDGFLSVNRQTLRHTKYDNIFGLGDVNDLPTTKTFFGGFSQMNVVRDNLMKLLNKEKPLVRYDGHTLAPVLIGQNQLQWMSHYYGGINNSLIQDLFSSVKAKNQNYINIQKNDLKNIYKLESWGPPQYKHPKTYIDIPQPEEKIKAFCQVHPN